MILVDSMINRFSIPPAKNISNKEPVPALSVKKENFNLDESFPYSWILIGYLI